MRLLKNSAHERPPGGGVAGRPEARGQSAGQHAKLQIPVPKKSMGWRHRNGANARDAAVGMAEDAFFKTQGLKMIEGKFSKYRKKLSKFIYIENKLSKMMI